MPGVLILRDLRGLVAVRPWPLHSLAIGSSTAACVLRTLSKAAVLFVALKMKFIDERDELLNHGRQVGELFFESCEQVDSILTRLVAHEEALDVWIGIGSQCASESVIQQSKPEKCEYEMECEMDVLLFPDLHVNHRVRAVKAVSHADYSDDPRNDHSFPPREGVHATQVRTRRLVLL